MINLNKITPSQFGSLSGNERIGGKNEKVGSLPCVAIIVLLLILLSGCNEKAEAIKLAAEKFSIEANTALDKIKSLFKQSISIPRDEDDKIKKLTKDLDETSDIDAAKLSFLLQETEIDKQTSDLIDQEFEKLKGSYIRFEQMFQSLPRGSYFAKDAVRKAEKQTMQLTLEMINFAEYLRKYPVQFTAQRVLIIEKIAAAKKTQDKNLRNERLSIISNEILQLAKDEQAAKQGAVTQCLKAAEAGKTVAALIRDYDSMSVNDMLVTINSTLRLVSDLGYSNQKLDTLIGEYKKYEEAVRKDPYWSSLLDEKITP